MVFKKISKDYDITIAELVRSNLRAFRLDIPGTAYYGVFLFKEL